MRPALQRTVELTDALVGRLMNAKPLPWMWGPGLLGYSLALLQRRLGDRRYDDYLLRFCRAHVGTPVHCSDTTAPALLTHELARDGIDEFAPLTQRALGYLAGAPDLPGAPGIPNHLGTGGYAPWYPASAWVDSVMMIGVFPAIVGADRGDRALLDTAALKPARFAALMRDDASGLWSHSWWAPAWHSPGGRRFPRRVFWARGNGWVAAALPMLLDAIGPDHPQADAIRGLNADLALALASRQQPDGGWTTLLNGRRRGPSETSAAALIAAGWLNSIRLGILPANDYRERADAALASVLDRIEDGPGGPRLRGVSGPTIPVPLAPRLGYLVIPEKVDAPWGVAALVFAALADDALN